MEYGTKRVQQNTRKRGINMLINIMSRFGRNLETESKVLYIINYSTVAAYLQYIVQLITVLWRGFIYVKIIEWNVNKSASRLYVYLPTVE